MPMPKPVILEEAWSARLGDDADSTYHAMRSALERQNQDLVCRVAAADRRTAEMERSHAQLKHELTNVKDGMHISAIRANEEALLRISQLQMQLAQAQSESAASAESCAEYMRAKMLLEAEIDSLRTETAMLRGACCTCVVAVLHMFLVFLHCCIEARPSTLNDQP
jgi:hypothetical protein